MARSLIHRARAAIAKAIAPKSGQRASYAGAQFTRLSSDWIFAATRSADGDLRYELRNLKNRARELVRNSPFGARYSQLIAENVVGPYGFQLQAKNQTKDGAKAHDSANQAIEDAWAKWSRPENCDVTKRLSLTELLSLAVSSWGTDGEILIRILRGPTFGPFGIALQVLDTDFLDEKLNQDQTGTSPMIRQGVEFDKWGAPVAYHLWTSHPYDVTGAGGSSAIERIRVPASDIIHAFFQTRPGQSRGVPHAAPILTTVKMLDGYVEAELVAARVASAKMAAVVDADPSNPSPTNTIGSGNEIPADSEPGSWLDLRGTSSRVEQFDPQHPTQAFPDFTRMMAHYVAMGWGISYGTLTGDLSQANYSSMRVGMLDERDHWKRLQQFVITHVLDRLYREWLKMALLNGQIPGIADMDVERWTTVEWQPRGFDWIDPVKDVQGDFLEVAAGTQTLTRIAAKRGRDFESILVERAKEIELLAQYDVPSTLATTITDRPQEDTGNGTSDSSTQGNTAAKPAAKPARVLRTA